MSVPFGAALARNPRLGALQLSGLSLHTALFRGRRSRPGAARTLGVALGGICALGSMACVSKDAGYADVRQLTAARIQRDVRWAAHEPHGELAAETRKLLERPLTADGAVQIALLENAGLQAAFEELGVARARLVQALRLPNPTVDAALRFSEASSDRPGIDVEALIDLTELVFLPLRGGAAEAALDAAKLSVTGRVLDLALEARLAFYEYQARAQLFELSGTVLSAVRASFEAAEGLHAAGNIPDLSLANERALYEEARIEYTAAEAALASQREALTAVMGLWGSGARWTAEARLPELSERTSELEQLEARALDRSLDLQLIERRYAAAAKGARVATARGWVPELRAGVAAEREIDAEEGWTVGPAVALEVPLFYQGQGETAAARAEMRREQQLYTDAAVRIRASARALASELAATERNAAHYRSVLLPLRQKIVDETQLQYNAMNVGVFQLLQAKRDQIRAAQRYVQLLRDTWALRARVDQLLAGRLPTAAAVAPSTNEDAAPATATGGDAH